MVTVKAPHTPQEIPDTTERRRHKRLRVQVPATLMVPGTDKSISALNQELSWGGAMFTTAEPLPRGIDQVLLNLPWVRGQQIAINASVLRTALLPNDQHLIVVRFSSLMPESHLRLEKLVKMLAGKDHPVDSRDATDLFHQLEVTVDHLDDFRRTLEQIATGRLILHTSEQCDENQSISLSVKGPAPLPELRLRARVVTIREKNSKQFAQSDLRRVTLQFEHPSKAIMALIDALLGRLP